MRLETILWSLSSVYLFLCAEEIWSTQKCFCPPSGKALNFPECIQIYRSLAAEQFNYKCPRFITSVLVSFNSVNTFIEVVWRYGYISLLFVWKYKHSCANTLFLSAICHWSFFFYHSFINHLDTITSPQTDSVTRSPHLRRTPSHYHVNPNGHQDPSLDPGWT